jgi:hypothetical protein
MEDVMWNRRAGMRGAGRTTALFGAAAIVLLAAGAHGNAYASTAWWDTDCHALKLKAATGVPRGPVHTYDFEGTCNLIWVKPTGPSVFHRFPAQAHVIWNTHSREVVEDFAMIGTFRWPAGNLPPGNPPKTMIGGSVHSVYLCNDDPIVVHDVACSGVSHQNDTGITALSNPFQSQIRPITRGKTTLAEATKLSGGSK